ncbi:MULTISPECIES: 3,4-dihydroxy-2-butanone-4-phosphate synthase [Sphingomonadaceae]|jgi:3,4-dihydroxy-2-butanone 4-phosphate synthase|uniref:3,4-dihydroxy-2-butanone-4-phosphate synthase n=1 Tax=Sphingomonadales TaxID=204457 RepID=UPI0000D7A63D|nr:MULTISPECIES: 3,4-dihydroxy-2-butanone-4-phosphate synthase [Sphingomonadaceae]EAT08752.1 riboflavin biosynthesis protein (RibA) [Sphingomonas sp. SKA58]MCC4256057.1 3,4-dihydroxy-2-butanone-4-phosphate synthase [Sphingobium lactosutens]|tara:strand:+ start:26214 stop:27242 length:1029 start_codon:yes stop_codon:yes gene_type:complete
MATQPHFDPDYVSPPLRRRVRPSLVSVPTFDADAAVTAIAAGGVAILAEGVSGDAPMSLIAAARDVDAHVVNFMARNGRGLICMPIAPEQARQIGLTAMAGAVDNNPRCPGFARSIEACSGVSTGISADDRARTMSVAAAVGAGPHDIVSPGHVFPIIGHENGLIGRCGATEAAIELVRLANRGFAAVLCRILRDDGEVATLADVPGLGWMQSLEAVDIGTLLAAQCARTRLVHRDDAPRFVGANASIQLRIYREQEGGREHYALLHGSRPDRERSVIRICRDNDAGQNIHTVAALAAAICESVSEPGASLILISGSEQGLAGDIVNEAIGGQILEDMVLNG